MLRKVADIMGMPVTVEIVDASAKEKDIEDIFEYLRGIDQKFSTYKKDSEISQINRGEILSKKYSTEMKKILSLSQETKTQTHGYFDIHHGKMIDPSGIVKGYAISQSVKKLIKKGYKNFYVEIAGDIEVVGNNSEKKAWKVGIENPFNRKEIIKIVELSNCGIATSGNYIRGAHVYDPLGKKELRDTVSMTVIGPTCYDADKFATAAFAMGRKGIEFIEELKGYEGHMILDSKKAIVTSGFGKFVI